MIAIAKSLESVREPDEIFQTDSAQKDAKINDQDIFYREGPVNAQKFDLLDIMRQFFSGLILASANFKKDKREARALTRETTLAEQTASIRSTRHSNELLFNQETLTSGISLASNSYQEKLSNEMGKSSKVNLKTAWKEVYQAYNFSKGASGFMSNSMEPIKTLTNTRSQILHSESSFGKSEADALSKDVGVIDKNMGSEDSVLKAINKAQVKLQKSAQRFV